jgi:hypothetical protein
MVRRQERSSTSPKNLSVRVWAFDFPDIAEAAVVENHEMSGLSAFSGVSCSKGRWWWTLHTAVIIVIGSSFLTVMAMG